MLETCISSSFGNPDTVVAAVGGAADVMVLAITIK